MILTGALVNCAAIVAGGILGTLGSRLMPEKMKETVLAATGLISIGIGVSGAIGSNNQLIPILALVLGSVLGELLHIDSGVTRVGSWLQARFGRFGPITEGFVSASLVFAVGAMAIMGALDSGLTGDHATLYAKSTLDGITSIVYGSTMGAGVALSGVAVFLYQGLITLCASFIAPFLSDVVIAEMKCVGSLLIIGLSFNMLGMTKIKVMNYVPAVFFPILLCTFM